MATERTGRSPESPGPRHQLRFRTYQAYGIQALRGPVEPGRKKPQKEKTWLTFSFTNWVTQWGVDANSNLESG